MEATRYRLRFVTGVSLTAATYGSGFYGSQTYGTKASDPVASLRYRLVPWPAGYLTDPAWKYRVGDRLPKFQATVLGDEGPLQVVGVALVRLVLTPIDENPQPPRQYDLTINGPTPAGSFWLERDWEIGDIDVPGTYRAGVIITYNSGRRLTVPIDDRQVFVIADNDVVPPSAWDDTRARWDEATWREDPTWT
jgi:hypothetical protein